MVRLTPEMSQRGLVPSVNPVEIGYIQSRCDGRRT